MQTPYLRPYRTAPAAARVNAQHWIAVVASGLLLVVASAGIAHASTARPRHVSAGASDAVAIASGVPAHTSERTEVSDLQPVRHSGHRCPTDSSDVWLEDLEGDDDGSDARVASGPVPPSVEETLGSRRPSRASGGSLTSDGRIAATQFLTDVVRRM
jgi:hypothetical protein